jgi:hypothetical protein
LSIEEAGQMNEAHKVTGLWRIVALLVLAFAAQGVPTAQAYDGGTCPGEFRDVVRQFKVDGGDVDFGDDLHLGGAPQGTAVACWDGNVQNANAARVILRGKLYLDYRTIGDSTVCASAVIKFLNANGTVRATHNTPDLCGTGGLRSRDVGVTVALPVTRIRLELFGRYDDAFGDPPHTDLARSVNVSFH